MASSDSQGRRKQYADVDTYEKKLYRVMERLGVPKKDVNWDSNRFECFVEFKYKGALYRFDHSVEKAKTRGVKLNYGSDAFAQVVLTLEDLARMVERGIYDLSAWVAGMKMLPPSVEVPSFFRVLGFEQIPNGVEEVKARFRSLAKQLHPDAGGNQEDFETLKKATEQAAAWFNKTQGKAE